MKYPTKKLQEVLDKTKFTIWKIKTSDYLSSWKNPIIDQWKSLIAWYSNNDELVYNWKLPVIVYWDHTNIVKYVDFPFIWWADWIKVLPFNNNCDGKYCYYLLETFKPKTQWYRRHFSFFKGIDLPLPPISTQKLIVQKLDSAFENIDKNINLTKENLKNLEELNKSVLEKIFSEWEYEIKTIDEIFKIKSWDFLPKSKMIESWNFNVYWWNWINWKHNEFNLDWENIIIWRVWALCWNVRFIEWKIWLTDNAFYISNYLINIDKKYLTKFLSYTNLWKTSNSSTQPVISYKTISVLKIPLPPLQKQKEIVEYLDEVFEKNKELKTKYESQLKELEELKQSLLKDAFEGKLV
jgi:type I restriction enzyme, S subunit